MAIVPESSLPHLNRPPVHKRRFRFAGGARWPIVGKAAGVASAAYPLNQLSYCTMNLSIFMVVFSERDDALGCSRPATSGGLGECSDGRDRTRR